MDENILLMVQLGKWLKKIFFLKKVFNEFERIQVQNVEDMKAFLFSKGPQVISNL